MTPIEISSVIFCCVLAGALAGMTLRTLLPKHHLDADTRDLVKLGVGLIGTMSALLLGLLVSSTKASYDARRTELTQIAANAILLDRALAHFGPEAADARAGLREAAEAMRRSTWSQSDEARGGVAARVDREVMFDKIQELVPRSDAQRALQAQAVSLAIGLGQTRWLLFAQSGTTISTPFLVVVVFWLTSLFISFGLFAPRNGTAVTALVVSAISVAGALFLVLELDQPFSGIMQLSDAPLRDAIAVLGR
jgi:hypothetical protein